jgi:hypothetical protein
MSDSFQYQAEKANSYRLYSSLIILRCIIYVKGKDIAGA